MMGQHGVKTHFISGVLFPDTCRFPIDPFLYLFCFVICALKTNSIYSICIHSELWHSRFEIHQRSLGHMLVSGRKR